MRRPLLCLSATLLALLAWTTGASANQVSCGDVITSDTTLDSDLLNCPGDGVVIGADNVTLNLAGHTIGGTGPGDGNQGVDNDAGHDGVEVRSGQIRDFHSAVYFDHADGGWVHGVTVTSGGGFEAFDSDSNVIERNDLGTIVLYFDSDANTIDRNRSSAPGTAVLIAGYDNERLADGNRITNNRLVGSGESFGVYVTLASDTSIKGNRVLDHSGTGIAVNGIGDRNVIERNVVSRTSEGIGVDGYVNATIVRANRVTDSAADGIRVGGLPRLGTTLVERNIATRNGDDGIDVRLAATTITRNTANFNADLGIEAVTGVTDGGGNRAHGNGNPAQCIGVSCN
jgi:parallel beta-helix repeat protein